MTSYITSADFVVVEQIDTGRYIQHVFDGEDQFKEWRSLANNRSKNIIARTNARGRMHDSIDHRFCPVDWF